MSRPPLTGLRVLDVSHNLAGPLTAMHLGDLLRLYPDLPTALDT